MAFLDHDWELAVLDVCFDSVVDATEPAGTCRTLRFTREHCHVQIDVHGVDQLTVDVETHPYGGVIVAALRHGMHGTTMIPAVDPQRPTELPSGLTSFVLRWTGGEHRPARTAWVVL